MTLLAIDTSTAQASIACYDVSGLLGECSWQTGRDHTIQLVPQLDLLLRHVGQTSSDVHAIAVALGPGSWSGLRVGMSAAKGFALARDLPLVGIGTLDLLAYQHAHADATVCPIIRLGRERFAAALFAAAPRAPFATSGSNFTLAELASACQNRTLFCGDVDSAVQATLTDLLGNYAIFPSHAARLRRAGYLAELAWQRLQAGTADNRATLEPIYLGQAVKAAPSV